MPRQVEILSKTTREASNIIENKSKVLYSLNRSNASRMNATSSKTDERIDKLADQLSTLVEIVSKKVVTPAPVKAVEETCVTCGGAHSWYNCSATNNNQASVCATTGTYNQVNLLNRVRIQMALPSFAPVQNNGQNRFNQNQVQGNNFRGNNFHGYQGSGTSKTEETTDKEQTNFQGSTAQIPPSVIPISIPKPDVPKTLPKTTSISESDIPKSLPKPNIPYPSRHALLLMPRFASTIKSLLMNKEKLLELAKIPLNENCSAMLLKKLPESLFTNEPALVCLPPSEDANDKKEKQEVKNLAEPTAKHQTLFAITSPLPSIEPKDSLIMGDEHLSTFSAEEIVPNHGIEDTSRSDLDSQWERSLYFRIDDLIPPGIESDFDSEEDNLLNDDSIPEYERLTFIMKPDVPVINNVDELNEDECFDPGGGDINFEVDDSLTFVTRTFLPYLTYPEFSSLLSSTKNEDTIFDPVIFT
ncbi:hypothetical protein Tco_0122680 [Tanacetum coccineum]